MSNLVNVEFYGDQLMIVNHNGEPYVPMRPVVENVGLAWQSQHEKLKSRFSTCVTEIVIQVDGDTQRRAYTCLPLRKLFGWLMTVSPNKVNPDIKDKIIRYQDECDDVLWQYWTGKHQSMQDELNKLIAQESISQAKGSFHGKGLNIRKQEKRVNERAILYIETLLQPQLTGFEQIAD